ncbi:N-acetylmuramoyl-L-alanine amidase [Pseudomonas sp. M47T1]|uniref:N-acetylmuramoyl-L-alanine amidase n=1 Tax=unclassified Pseudomonas TaxID=196821 RepID=UPI0002608116|nr:N-acetylmuramoyl-L-alanine amidase [Pseudomonas sp. M47T1]EIK93380.1 N-acetylmuramoyl-L-alanine amidase [Pseudomonas sp. M47T1]
MNRRTFLGLISAVSLMSPTGLLAAPLPGVSHCQFSHQAGLTSLMLDVTGTLSYQVFTLGAPDRVVIDLHGVAAHLPPGAPNFAGTPVRGMRSGPTATGMRLVLDMHQPAHAQARLVHLAGGRQRLVVDLPVGKLALARQGLKQPPKQRPAVIAIDAGHGGKDPGAVGRNKHYEKTVVLGIASLLHQQLGRDPRFHPTMSRTSDFFVPLHQRVLLAHQRRADMLVSIHADAAPSRSARGASVYVLSPHGATSAMARYIAESENSSDAYAGVFDKALSNDDPMVSKVLVDMSMNATIASSLDLGRTVLGHFKQVTNLHQQRVEQAGFAVLKSPDIPSILVEHGFMSNPYDCGRLIDHRHQVELAQALHASIGDYFHKYPVHVA